MAFEIFISSASEDNALRKELEKHLVPLTKHNDITLWKERDISAGRDRQTQLLDHLNRARMILLLISPDFMESHFCYDQMQRALDRHKANKACVIAILLRPVDYKSDHSISDLPVLPSNEKFVTKWRLRDEAYLEIVEGIKAVIQDFKEKRKSSKSSARIPRRKSNRSKSVSGNNGYPSTIAWTVPFKRDPYFTGREEILLDLHTMLVQEHATGITQPPAIYGLGGIGKTHIAIEYAYRYKDEYRYVLWVQADTNETIAADYVSLAHLLECLEPDMYEQKRAVEAMKEWLENNADWLLIFDNVNNFQLVDTFLPSNMCGHVLITTRDTARSGFAARGVEIDVMGREDGAMFLLRRAELLFLDSPLAEASESDRNAAIAIVKEMDGLPLALDQAAAYIKETGSDLINYLEIYKKHRADLLKKRGGSFTHSDSVTTTFDMAFKNVQQTNPAAADLLRLCAFLAPDAIPEEIFTSPQSETDEIYQLSTYTDYLKTNATTWRAIIKKSFTTLLPRTTSKTSKINTKPELETALSTFVDDLYAFDVALGELRKFSLIRRITKERTLFVHRLVQAVLQDELDEHTRQQWEVLTVQKVAHSFPEPGYADMNINARFQRQRMFSHALTCITYIRSGHEGSLAVMRLLNNVGGYLYDQAQYEEAEQLLQLGITISKRVLGVAFPYHLQNLGKLYDTLGKYQKAKKTYQQMSKSFSKLFGSSFTKTDIIAMSNNEAQLYQSQGKYREAEQLYKRTLEIRKELLGEEHPLTAFCIGGLATIYWYQGRYQEAEVYYQKARQVYEKNVGIDHPEVAVIVYSLGCNYSSQGRYKEAEPLFKQALASLEKTYGQEHPRVAQIWHNMAKFYYEQNRDDEALLSAQRALAIREKRLGEEHSLTATSIAALAGLYCYQGKYAEAEPLYEKALKINEKVEGPKHYSASIMGSLAGMYIDQQKYKEAESLGLQALTIQERELGLNHPDTAAILGTLGRLYAKQGIHKKAEQYFKQALSIDEKALGSGHPQIALDLGNLAVVYTSQGRLEEAEQLTRRGLIISERAQGSRKDTRERLREQYNDIRQRRQHHMTYRRRR